MQQRGDQIVSSISFEEIEGSKENVQPLKSGRDPQLLKRALAAQEAPADADDAVRKASRAAVAEEEIVAKVAAFEAEVERLKESEDPLMPWLKYIAWVQQRFPSGNHMKSEQSEDVAASCALVPLLERCTRAFKDHEQYKDDRRYLKVWIFYVDACPEPEDIFAFMRSKRIGQKFAVFYIAWSRVLEANGKLMIAEKVLEAGLKVNAQPAAQLREVHRALQRRVAKKIKERVNRESQEAAPAGAAPGAGSSRSRSRRRVTSDENANPQLASRRSRRALGQLSEDAARRSVRRSAAPQPLPPSRAAAVLSQVGKKANATIEVFDESEEVAAAEDVVEVEEVMRERKKKKTKRSKPRTMMLDTLEDYVPSAIPASGNEAGWDQLQTQAVRRKENTQKATTWNEPLRRDEGGDRERGREGVREHERARPAPKSTIPVFEDEECEEDDDEVMAQGHTAAAAAAPSLRQRLDGPVSSTELLHADPLRHFEDRKQRRKAGDKVKVKRKRRSKRE